MLLRTRTALQFLTGFYCSCHQIQLQCKVRGMVIPLVNLCNSMTLTPTFYSIVFLHLEAPLEKSYHDLGSPKCK